MDIYIIKQDIRIFFGDTQGWPGGDICQKKIQNFFFSKFLFSKIFFLQNFFFHGQRRALQLVLHNSLFFSLLSYNPFFLLSYHYFIKSPVFIFFQLTFNILSYDLQFILLFNHIIWSYIFYPTILSFYHTMVGDYINTIKTIFNFNFDLYQAVKQHGYT